MDERLYSSPIINLSASTASERVFPFKEPAIVLKINHQTMTDEIAEVAEQVGEEQSASLANLPLEERLRSKDWKHRLNGVDELKNIIQPDTAEDILSNLSGFIPGITADSNANVLEMGDSVSNVVEKAFGGRPSTQTKGKRLMLKVMEVANVTTCSTILLSKFSDRRPKIPPMCIDIITEAIGLFGIGLFPIKEIVKGLPGVFNGNNSGAREAAMKLIIEIHRWVGMAPIQSLLDELRSAQKAEFEKILGEKASEQSAGPPVPSLYTKKDRLALESGAPIIQNQRSIDARAFCEEIDLSKKLKGTEFPELVASEKWSDQSNALQLLQKLMGPTPVLKYNRACSSAAVIFAYSGSIRRVLKGQGQC
eukprot:scaffold1091_cov164-Ochromonas_danica.AAC.47